MDYFKVLRNREEKFVYTYIEKEREKEREILPLD